jgi:diphosphomevalonate decarboxylase
MATAIAHPNIALVKYWGKRDLKQNLPSTSSISLTLAPFYTRTTVTADAERDDLWINGELIEGTAAERVFKHLDKIEPWRTPSTIVSEANFPIKAGLASSASGFAALTLAAAATYNQNRSTAELSTLARQGSGSACRSMFGGWVEWPRGSREDGLDSHARVVAQQDHWDVRMVVVVLHDGPKDVGSTEGMLRTQKTSPYYRGWVESNEKDIEPARKAILSRDIEALGTIMERSALRMHASMLSADPPIRYWKSNSVWAMDAVENLRSRGYGAWWTMDAGPNIKVICAASDAKFVAKRFESIAKRVEILEPGGPARLEPESAEE